MKLKAIVFIMTSLPFFAFSQFATMKQSEPIKALNGRTHKIKLFLDEKENIVSLSPNKVAFVAIKGKKKTLCTVDLK